MMGVKLASIFVFVICLRVFHVMELLHHHTIVLFNLVLINVSTRLILKGICIDIYLYVYLWSSHEHLLVYRDLTDVSLRRSWAEQAFIISNSS
jgi:hypothetical protein